jgi:hypothetical protein
VPKRYTLEEANALLDHLAPLLVELREKMEKAAAIKETVSQAAAGNGWSEEREGWSRTLARVGELFDRITEWELQLRDLSTGLVDFPTVIDGDEAFFCWRLGETEIAHWHSPEDGFQGRRPL